jgi:hypothetical protein
MKKNEEKKTNKKNKKNKNEGVSTDDLGRRVWDKQLFEKKAKEREKNNGKLLSEVETLKKKNKRVPITELKPLTAREENIGLENVIGSKKKIKN